ncbi:hypothetical protein ACP4OV_012267 [Aristida adscensionis]
MFSDRGNDNIFLTTGEGGGVGCGVLADSGRLCLWSMESGPGRDVVWVKGKVIQMVSPVDVSSFKYFIVRFVDGCGVVYMGTDYGSYTTDLQFRLLRKVEGVNGFDYVVPYTGVYNPALGMALAGDNPGAGASGA